MRRFPLVVALVAAAFSIPFVVGDEVKLTKGQRVETDLTSKLYPKEALPRATKAYYGRVRNILSRGDSFGFSVRDSRIPSEAGFYLPNPGANRTIIDAVLLAAQKDAEINVHYNGTTFGVDAVEVVLSY